MHTIWNERVKYLATACNNVGIAALLAGFIVPMINGQGGGLAWYVFGVVWISVAQLLLGELK
jgi:hypothetical protein